MEVIHSENAPAEVGPYSQAVCANGVLYLSGQIGINPAAGRIEGTTVREQAEQVCMNIGAVLAKAGLDFSAVVKTTCFLTDMAAFAEFNDVYERYFIGKPARSCVAVSALPAGALCEIEAVAVMER
ncbi:MAG: RidA family protein [Treponema sp.]|nr:RidA family protein [Treponema sp.]